VTVTAGGNGIGKQSALAFAPTAGLAIPDLDQKAAKAPAERIDSSNKR
jgi:hypothetical protein